MKAKSQKKYNTSLLTKIQDGNEIPDRCVSYLYICNIQYIYLYIYTIYLFIYWSKNET